MKTTLTIEESAKLIELGVDPKLASSNYVGRWVHYSTGTFADPESVEPIFTLTDILSILPKDINNHPFDILWDKEFNEWNIGYIGLRIKQSSEIIDALCQLLIWCIKNGHYNPKK